jgi:hypothetical protein
METPVVILSVSWRSMDLFFESKQSRIWTYRKGMGPVFFVEWFIKTKIIQRIETLYNSPIKEVDQEQQRLIWLNYTNFVKEGANLNPEARRKC